jgi:hypothetical protein
VSTSAPIKVVYDNFTGLDQQPEGPSSSPIDSFNVDFIDGKMVRRNGREALSSTLTVRPSKVVYDNGAGLSVDVTELITDGNVTTAAITNAFVAAGAALYVGCPFLTGGIHFELSGTHTNVGATISVKGYSASSNSFSVPRTVADGTATGGDTMKISGTVTVTINASTLQQVNSGSSAANAVLAGLLDTDLYWWQITTSTNFPGISINEVWLTLSGGGATLASESYGMSDFVTRTGDRLLVSSSQWPGLYDDADNVLVGGSVSPFVGSLARAWYYDLGRGDLVPIRIPPHIRGRTIPGQQVSYQTFNGWLIGCTTAGYLWKYDGNNCSALESLSGLDARNNVLGAQSYLLSTPRGTILETYHSKLMVAGDPTAPLNFYASMEDNNITLIPTDATVGGPNVWPLRRVFGIPGRAGDSITGASVINDRYCLLTRSQLWVFDEDSLRMTNGDVGCVARGSIQRIDNLLYFLSDQGIYVFDSVNTVNISAPISKFLRDTVTWSAVEHCTSAHHRSKGEYWLWLPINGEWQQQIAVVYNYITKKWRMVGGWYPFDTNGRRGNNVVQSVTAATTVIGSDGHYKLITIDSNGDLWNEDTGLDDNSNVFPAYAGMRTIAIPNPEDYHSFRDWYIDVEDDGQWYEGYALAEGERFSQEIDRRFANVATNSEVVNKRALSDVSVGGVTQPTYATVSGWGNTPNFPQPRKLKLSFARHLTKMQPYLHWAPGQYSAGSYSPVSISNGAVKQIQIECAPKGGAR